MQLTTVESSLIHAVGYDDEAREMEVVFNSGSIYRYVDVDCEVYERRVQRAVHARARHRRLH